MWMIIVLYQSNERYTSLKELPSLPTYHRVVYKTKCKRRNPEEIISRKQVRSSTTKTDEQQRRNEEIESENVKTSIRPIVAYGSEVCALGNEETYLECGKESYSEIYLEEKELTSIKNLM